MLVYMNDEVMDHDGCVIDADKIEFHERNEGDPDDMGVVVTKRGMRDMSCVIDGNYLSRVLDEIEGANLGSGGLVNLVQYQK